MINVSGDPKTRFEEGTITLINPHLDVVYVWNNEIEQKINRLKGNSLKYSDYPLKTIILSEGLSEYNLTLMYGKNLLIKYIFKTYV